MLDPRMPAKVLDSTSVQQAAEGSFRLHDVQVAARQQGWAAVERSLRQGWRRVTVWLLVREPLGMALLWKACAPAAAATHVNVSALPSVTDCEGMSYTDCTTSLL